MMNKMEKEIKNNLVYATKRHRPIDITFVYNGNVEVAINFCWMNDCYYCKICNGNYIRITKHPYIMALIIHKLYYSIKGDAYLDV